MNNLGFLYQYECKKLWKKKMIWVTLLISFIVTALSVFSGRTEPIDQQYHKALNGRKINQELLEEMSNAYHKIPDINSLNDYRKTKEYQTYARPYSDIFGFVRGNLSMNTAKAIQWIPNEHDLYNKRMEMLEQEWQDSALKNEEKEFWRQKESELKTPFTYQSTDSAFSLFRALNTLGLLVPMAVAVCLSNIFAEEHIRKTDQLILCSKHGKRIAYWAKILAGISFASAISLIVSIVAFTFVFAFYGKEDYSATFQLIYQQYSYPLTAQQAIFILYGILLVTSVLISVIVMVLSELLHSGIATLAITTGIFIFSMICSIPSQYRVFSQLWDWFPSKFVTPWNIFDVRLLSIFEHYFTAWQIVPILYCLSGMILVIIGKSIYQHYQVSGR